MSGLLDARTIRELAAQLDLRPTKQRGQNFVIDANTVRRIVALARVEPDDVALEIGPGLGSLTLGLLEVARHVTAVEIEDSLAAQLPITAAARVPGAADRRPTLTASTASRQIRPPRASRSPARLVRTSSSARRPRSRPQSPRARC